jgi:4-amino-4-deoxy-L-arabinose transferase-like glycosyltransferase
VIAVYFIRIDDLTIRGEESRRATVAMEMLATGDWIVPRQQGDPNFMSARPPLQSWAMAVIGLLRGQVDTVAVRLPSVMAILLTVLLVYGYCRTFLTGAGAFAAGAAYATMGQVMELGRLGETDAMFALFVSGSLLLWHWGVTRQWRPAVTWTVAWLCVALGTLTKGLQAPTYFVAAVGMYLFITRQWRFAMSWSHALGIGVALIVVGLWQAPYIVMMGFPAVQHIYAGDVSLYLNDWSFSHVAAHYATYPLRVLGGLVPWSLVLLLLLKREVRKGVAAHRDNLLFVMVCLAVALPTVWFIPGARTRFFMSMYPCLAVLVGIVIDRCTQELNCRLMWQQVLTVIAVGVAAFGVVVTAASAYVPGTAVIAQPPMIAVSVIAACGFLAWVM